MDEGEITRRVRASLRAAAAGGMAAMVVLAVLGVMAEAPFASGGGMVVLFAPGGIGLVVGGVAVAGAYAAGSLGWHLLGERRRPWPFVRHQRLRYHPAFTLLAPASVAVGMATQAIARSILESPVLPSNPNVTVVGLGWSGAGLCIDLVALVGASLATVVGGWGIVDAMLRQWKPGQPTVTVAGPKVARARRPAPLPRPTPRPRSDADA